MKENVQEKPKESFCQPHSKCDCFQLYEQQIDRLKSDLRFERERNRDLEITNARARADLKDSYLRVPKVEYVNVNPGNNFELESLKHLVRQKEADALKSEQHYMEMLKNKEDLIRRL